MVRTAWPTGPYGGCRDRLPHSEVGAGEVLVGVVDEYPGVDEAVDDGLGRGVQVVDVAAAPVG
jgi:hypothetical protein